jgi:glucosamine-6-phosphate deaminase
MDRAASESLTRFRCPWTIKGVTKQLYLNFDDYLKKKAIIWLSQTLGKSISKLVADDYEMNGLY